MKNLKFLKTILLAICFFLMLPAFMAVETFAAQYYIATDGNDTTGNGSIGSPWATLGKAHENMLAGDTVNFRGGTYTTNQYTIWTLTGTLANPITIRAYPGETPFIDGSAFSNVFLKIKKADYIIVDGLKVKGYHNAVWIGKDGPDSTNHAKNNVIRNNYFYDQAEHCIYVSWGNENIKIYNNIFEDPGGHPLGPSSASGKWCIHFWHGPGVQRADIYNNILADGSGGGIVFSNGATDVNVYNNTFYGNDKGIRIMKGQRKGSSKGVIRLTVKNNIFYTLKSNYRGFYLSYTSQDEAEITTDYNLWYKVGGGDNINWNGASYNLSEYQTNTNNGNNAIEADPDLVTLGLTRATSDFHLQLSSPAIDAGTALGAPSTDFDKTSRYKGSGYDIGAYEYGGSLLSPPEIKITTP